MNKIRDLLCILNISSNESIEPYYPQVRDRDDVSVYKYKRSGAIFLSRIDHIEDGYYEQKDDFEYWGENERQQALVQNREDDKRRSKQFEPLIAGKKWLDVGTGLGGVLDKLSPVARVPGR
jgi:hypothetical protein